MTIDHTADNFVREHLVELFDLWTEIKVLGHLLNSLPAHRGLNYILCAHVDARHRCVAKRGVDNVSWNLRSRRENLPDLETAFELNHFNHLHRILAILFRIFRQNGRDLGPRKIFATTMQRGYITATAANRGFLTVDGRQLGCYYRSAVRSNRPIIEAIADKRVDIDAKICPALSGNHCVWDLGMRLA